MLRKLGFNKKLLLGLEENLKSKKDSLDVGDDDAEETNSLGDFECESFFASFLKLKWIECFVEFVDLLCDRGS